MHARWKNLVSVVSLTIVFGACNGIQTTSEYRSRMVPVAVNMTSPVTRDAPSKTVGWGVIDPESPLSFAEAWSHVQAHNPELAIAAMEIDRHAENVDQVGVLTNPELELSAENFGGSADASGFDAVETTVQVAQTIELGGKRAARRRVARDERRAARLAFSDDLLRIARDTRLAYVEVARTQRHMDIASDLVDAAREAVDLAVDDPAAAAAARVEMRQAEIERRHAQAELESARHELAALGGAAPSFVAVVDTLDESPALPSIAELVGHLDTHPRIAAARAAIAAAESGRDLARAEAVLDITPSFGARRFYESDETAFVVGLSMPLQFFDRKQGERGTTRIRARQAREAHRAAEIEVRSRLIQAYEALAAARHEVDVLRGEVLPDARRAFAAAADSHRHGSLGQPVVLSARQAWREAEGRLTDALAACQRWRAEVDRWSANAARN